MCCFSDLFDRILFSFFFLLFFQFHFIFFNSYIYMGFFGERAQNQICMSNGE